MPKILWLGDAGCTTGFARATHAIGDRLVRDFGHEVHVLAVNYDGDAGRWDTPMKLYLPTKLQGGDVYGKSRFVEMLAAIMPDVVVMLNDPHVIIQLLFRNDYDQELLLARSRPIVAYMPVDGTNQPSNWNKIGEYVSQVPEVVGGTGGKFYPVAMSKYGANFFKTDHMAYHAVDTKTYRKISEKDPLTLPNGLVIKNKGDAKEAFGLPRDSFLVLRVDRNSNRKNFGDTWRALVPVMKRHKNVHAWFHCSATGDQLDLPELFSRDMETASRFFYPPQFSTKIGWPEETLVGLYNAADVFVSTSGGEGFGLTLAEAAACEVPIIAQDVSAIPEVVGPGGILLKPQRLQAVMSGQDQWLPDVAAFTDAIETLYMSSGKRRTLGALGRQHVIASFDWDVAARTISELITKVAQANPEMPALDLPGDENAEPESVAV